MKGHQHQMFILSIQITGRKKSRCLSWKFRPHRAPKSSLYCYECEGEFCQQSEQGSNWMKSLERYILYMHTTSVVLKSTDCHFQTMFLFQNISITELSMPRDAEQPAVTAERVLDWAVLKQHSCFEMRIPGSSYWLTSLVQNRESAKSSLGEEWWHHK